jgi:nitrogen regulatory protein PII
VGGSSNPVRAAYMASLESQISSLRDELATVYKTQGQNAQRLLSMNETLREKEEVARVDAETIRKLREEIAVLRRKVDQHAELMSEKDRTAQVGGHITSSRSVVFPDGRLVMMSDPSRRNKYVTTRTRTDRREKPDIDKRQCQALTTVA